MQVSFGLIAMVFAALLLLLLALSIAYSDKLRYKLLPPKCEKCGKKEGVRRFYKDYNPKDPSSLGSEFLCPKCEAEELRAQLEHLRMPRGKKEDEDNKEK
jgi:hypothetical protein